MCLPAANATVQAWIKGFGLQPMPEMDLDAACKDMHLLIFPGTEVLHKQLLPPLSPKQGPPMTPWAGEPAGPLTDGQKPIDPELQALAAEAITSPVPLLGAKAAAVAAANYRILPVQTQPETARMPPTTAAAVGAAIQDSSAEVHCSYPAVNVQYHMTCMCPAHL